MRTYVSFDWAIKKLLRDKANFDVLEGFLSELLQIDVKIQEILESEANKMTEADKYDRVDILVKSDKDELILIEIQYDSEVDYFHRMLYNMSKMVAEYMQKGSQYGRVKNTYAINILCHNESEVENYLYKYEGVFFGVHRSYFSLPPEYRKGKFQLQVLLLDNSENQRNYFSDVQVKFLPELVSDIEKLAYQRFVENRRIEMGVLETAEEEGKEEEKKTIAQNMKVLGLPTETIAQATGLSTTEINEL